MDMNENIKLLNYCQDAIKDLKECERGLLYACPISSHVIRKLTELIADSVKFILPNCADFIDPSAFSQTHLDLAHLPYPIVAFEIPWVKAEPMRKFKDFPTTLSTKRIALCIDYTHEYKHLCPVPNLDTLLDRFPEGGVLVFSIYYVDRDNTWMLCQGGAFVPYDNRVESTLNSSITPLPATMIAVEQLSYSGQISEKHRKQFQVEPFIVLPELCNQLQAQMGSRDKFFADILLNTRDEVFAYIGACSLLNCANVIVEPAGQLQSQPATNLPPSARKKLKPPKSKFEYKVLQISDERLSHKPASSGQKEPSMSKRTHLRRGHIRRLKERLIWVRPSIINPGSPAGLIAKDYKLNPGNGSNNP